MNFNGATSNHSSASPLQPERSRSSSSFGEFDQPVILQQSPRWSRAIVWGIVGVTSFTVLWAAVAQFEEAIPATGKLEPQAAVKEVQAPVNGVVREIHVKEGDRVQPGQLLLSLDPTTVKAQQASLEQIRASLLQENQFYQSQMGRPSGMSATAGQLNVPPQVAMLTANRAALVAETQLYRAELNGSPSDNLNAEQQARLRSRQAEVSSREAAAKLEIDQLQRQFSQNQIQLANAKDSLSLNQKILADIEPLLEDGALPRLQILRQQQEVRNKEAEVAQLTQEQARLNLAIAQAQEQWQNTIAVSQTDLLGKIADNEKQIAQIDSQINKSLVENEKRISEIDSQLSQAQVTLQYQELRAPTKGVIFDLQPQGPGYVLNASQPVLKLVPDDALLAQVYITNRDIGFVKEGMPVDVRIDSFPFSEYGDVKGQVTWIGSDALPPDEIRPYYTFPAKIRLDKQSLAINDRQLTLQSGMSISANIKVRKRTVMSIFTDLFVRKIESLQQSR